MTLNFHIHKHIRLKQKFAGFRPISNDRRIKYLCKIELFECGLHDRILDGTEHKLNVFGVCRDGHPHFGRVILRGRIPSQICPTISITKRI